MHEELIELLEKWLQMADPFDVYLKALLHLFESTDIRREREASTPSYYQKDVAIWAVRQIENHGGALLVVATGLGKTVMGAEIAGLLDATGDIGQVVLLAPRSVHRLWKAELHGRRVVFDAFDNQILFRKDKGQNTIQASALATLLSDADPRMLILIDEAHLYRNQLLRHHNGQQSLVIERICRAAYQGARIVLMTGSAYGTSMQNLDSLLYLLPHRNPDTLTGPRPWEAGSYQAFSTLPPVIIISYSHVLEMAQQRGDVEDGYPYVDFGSKRRYFPTTLKTQRVMYHLPLEEEVKAAFAKGYFNLGSRVPTLVYSDDVGELKTLTDTIYNVTLDGWLSSPRALLDCLTVNLNTEGLLKSLPLFGNEPDEDGSSLDKQQVLWEDIKPKSSRRMSRSKRASGYQSSLSLALSERREPLEALKLQLQPLQNFDNKAQRLLDIILERRKDGAHKMIIFIERLVTALYLKRILSARMRGLRVACTVERSGKLKSPKERLRLLAGFSPEAHGLSQDESEFDVLLCTDADGVGINLQDSDTIVNYDLTAGADRLVQRLGRILRATPEPGRIPYIYTFLPSCLDNSEPDGVYCHIQDRYSRLLERHERSSAILNSRILASEGYSETVRLDGEVDLRSLMNAHDPLAIEDQQESLASHLSVLERYRERAEALPHTLHSTRYYDGEKVLLVILIRHANRYYPLVVDPATQDVITEEPLTALNLLACPPDALKASEVLSVTVVDILNDANEAIRIWSEERNLDITEVERILALYLLPKPSVPT